MATFYQTVSEAIREFEEHGFDSVERLQYWTERIRKAAVESLTPESVLNETLNRALGGIYKKLVDDGQILKAHQGVARFTVDRLKPKLHAELDRRLMVSRSLIKLNREAMIEKTTQRFAGWASSIPAGGSRAVEVKDVKENVRKALTSLSFEERRCMIDQGAKFASALNDIIAMDGGAIAAIWKSMWRRSGYSYREDHKERDQKVFAIRGNWALEKGLMKAGPDGYTDQITKPGEEVYCFPGDSKVPYAGLVEKAYRRWYDGELTEIVTSSGKLIRATPNHPILTVNGWQAIGSLNEGDDIIEVAEELLKASVENQYEGVASIADIFRTLEENGIVETLDLRSTDFHGDGRDGNVDVVLPARELTFDFMTPGAQSIDKFRFSESDKAGSGLGHLDQGTFSSFASAHSVMRIGNKFGLFLIGKLRHSVKSGFDEISNRYASLFKPLCNWASSDAEALRDGQDAFASQVGGDDRICIKSKPIGRAGNLGADVKTGGIYPVPEGARIDVDDLCDLRNGLPFITKTANIVKVNRSWFSGHVFNLETERSLYVVNGIIAHNCSCHYQYLYNIRDLPDDMVTAKGRESLAEARAKIAAMRK